jgi:hypothetical protein
VGAARAATQSCCCRATAHASAHGVPRFGLVPIVLLFVSLAARVCMLVLLPERPPVIQDRAGQPPPPMLSAEDPTSPSTAECGTPAIFPNGGRLQGPSTCRRALSIPAVRMLGTQQPRTPFPWPHQQPFLLSRLVFLAPSLHSPPAPPCLLPEPTPARAGPAGTDASAPFSILHLCASKLSACFASWPRHWPHADGTGVQSALDTTTAAAVLHTWC